MRLVLPLKSAEGPRPPGRPAAPGGPGSPLQGSPSAFQALSTRLPAAPLNPARYRWEENGYGLSCRLVDHPTRMVGSVVYGNGLWHWRCIVSAIPFKTARDFVDLGHAYFKHEAQLKIEEIYDTFLAQQVEEVLKKTEEL